MKTNMKISKLLLVIFFTMNLTSCFDSEEIDFGKGPVLAQFEDTTDELNIIKDDVNLPIDYLIWFISSMRAYSVERFF